MEAMLEHCRGGISYRLSHVELRLGIQNVFKFFQKFVLADEWINYKIPPETLATLPWGDKYIGQDNTNFLKHKRILYKVANIMSIPAGLFGNEIKPNSIFISSSEYEIKKASWDSSLDYFSQVEEEFTVTYFVDVGKVRVISEQ